MMELRERTPKAIRKVQPTGISMEKKSLTTSSSKIMSKDLAVLCPMGTTIQRVNSTNPASDTRTFPKPRYVLSALTACISTIPSATRLPSRKNG